VLEMKRLFFIVSCLVLFHFKFRLVQKMQTWQNVAAEARKDMGARKQSFYPQLKFLSKALPIAAQTQSIENELA